jgi:chemotaxis protein MotA
MHIVLGILGLAAVLAATFSVEQTGTFTGLFYGPALLLVGAGPLCIALASFRGEELLGALRALIASARFSATRSRATLYEELTAFAEALRQRQPARALELAEAAEHALLQKLAPLAIKQYDAAALEKTAAVATACQASELRRAEDVLLSLARVAPAAGLIGTVLGLIGLLKNLGRFEQLGPSMALALLCTLYGLVLANAVYQPLARLLRTRAQVLLEESRLLTRALLLLGEGRPLADVRSLFETGAPPQPAPAEREAA